MFSLNIKPQYIDVYKRQDTPLAIEGIGDLVDHIAE